jgi:hypothetical protein
MLVSTWMVNLLAADCLKKLISFLLGLESEFNLLAQILPQTLGRLSNLKRLLLDRNLFRGNIQSEFGHLSKLGTITY